MHFLVGDAWFGDAYGFEVGTQHNLIYGFLTAVELASNGHRAGDVAAVVHRRLASGVHHQHAALRQLVVVTVVVQCFTVNGHDDGETYRAVALPSLAFHKAGQLVLIAARHGHLHGAHMHVVCCGYGFLYLSNLLGTLDAALLYAGQC